MDGDYQLVNFDNQELFQNFINKVFCEELYDGFNITAPYKVAAWELAQQFSQAARLTQSVNTISLEKGQIIGHNTDVFGFEKGLTQLGSMPSNAIVIGVGGVARSIAFVLLQQDFKKITFVYRSFKSVGAIDKVIKNLKSFLKSKTQIEYVNFHNLVLDSSEQLIINASNIDAKDNAFWHDLELVMASNCNKIKFYDLNYSYDLKPLPSELLCQKHNIKNINGLIMLIYQAKQAFEIWTKSKINLNSQNLKNLLEYLNIRL